MWVFAYDPKDEKYVQRRNKSYWPLRDGSPIREKSGVWVPTNFVPALREFSETGDLYIGYLPEEEGPQRQKFYTSADSPGRHLHQKLGKLDPDDFAIGIEFTYHTNWSSNAIQRSRILYDSVEAGIPTIYAVPESAVSLRGTERRGDQNERMNDLTSALEDHCRQLVQRNEPITFENIQEHISENIKLELGDTERVNPDPKAPLFCRTLQDSFGVPCCTVQYDEVVTTVPRDWKLAGCQLEPVFDAIRAAITWIQENGTPASVESNLFEEHNKRDDQIMEDSPPGRKGVRRHDRWDDYHANSAGFPHGSLGIVTDPPKRYSTEHNYTLPSPGLADLHFHPNGKPTEQSYNIWIDKVGESRSQNRIYGDIDMSLMPNDFDSRPIIVTFNVTPYGGSRDHIDRWQNVDERTYAGKAILIDMCCLRSSIDREDRPRAMSTERRDRDYLFAVNLPMPSEVLFENFRNNARYRVFVDFADLIVCDDGGYLGRIWWEDDTPTQIF